MSWDRMALYEVACKIIGNYVTDQPNAAPMCLLWSREQKDEFSGIALDSIVGVKRAHLISDLLSMDVAISGAYTTAELFISEPGNMTEEDVDDDEKCYFQAGPKMVACIECRSLNTRATVVFVTDKPLLLIDENEVTQPPPWGFILSPFRAEHYQRYDANKVVRRVTSEHIELTNGNLLPLLTPQESAVH